MFLERNQGAARFDVTLYGSLAATGKGHMTDAAILEVLSPVAKTNIIWEPKVFLPFHPNGLQFRSFGKLDDLQYWRRNAGKRNLQRVDTRAGLRNAYHQGYTSLV